MDQQLQVAPEELQEEEGREGGREGRTSELSILYVVWGLNSSANILLYSLAYSYGGEVKGAGAQPTFLK